MPRQKKQEPRELVYGREWWFASVRYPVVELRPPDSKQPARQARTSPSLRDESRADYKPIQSRGIWCGCWRMAS